jgi:hypothetical protein
MADIVAPSLATVITKSWQEGVLPDDWKNATVIPIPKKKSSSNPCDYRPVSLTSIPGKVAERFVYEKINSAIDSCLPQQQYGFRRNKGTTNALIAAEQKIVTAMEECQGSTRVAVISFDIHKAFDTVSHNRLLQHICANFQLSYNARRWIKAFLIKRRQRVRVGVSLSMYSYITSGVPQGTILGPILYNAATAGFKDIPLSQGASTVIYADDLLLIKQLESKQQEKQLQDDCDKINEFYRRERLKINGGKTKMLLVSVNPSGSSSVDPPIKVDGAEVDRTEQLLYLGITLDERLSFTPHSRIVARRTRQMLGAIGLTLRKWRMNREMAKIYIACIRPVLAYGAAVYYGKTKEGAHIIEKVNKGAAKMILNDYEMEYSEMMSKLGWSTLEWTARREQQILMYRHVQSIKGGGIWPELMCIIPEENRRTPRLSNNHRFTVEGGQPRLNRSIQSTVNQMTRCWNLLPECVVSSDSLSAFKRKLEKDEVKSLIAPMSSGL